MSTPRFILVAAVMAIVSVALALGFAFFMKAKAEVWSAAHEQLPVPLIWAINTAELIRRFAPIIVVALVLVSFGLAAVVRAVVQGYGRSG